MICSCGWLLNSNICCTVSSVKWFSFLLPSQNKFIVYWRKFVSYGLKKKLTFFFLNVLFFTKQKKLFYLFLFFFFFLELKSFKLKYLVRHMLKPLYTSQTNCAALPLTHISKTNCIFLQSFQEFHNCFPRLLRCWMWLYLKEREREVSLLCQQPKQSGSLGSCSWSQGCELNQLHVYHGGTKHTTDPFFSVL